ncbi:MAG: hypothetical protein QXD64_08830 [Thermoplasmata archaeon]
MNDIIKKRDYIGPYMSALGYIVGFLLYLWLLNLIASYHQHNPIFLETNPIFGLILYALIFSLPILLPLLFSTCQHRKYKIFSLGGIGGSIGAIFSWIISPLFIYILPVRHGPMYSRETEEIIFYFDLVIYIFITALITFVFSRYFCRKFGKRWWNEKVCQCGK